VAPKPGHRQRTSAHGADRVDGLHLPLVGLVMKRERDGKWSRPPNERSWRTTPQGLA
jgi:hypothetical protein